MGKKAFFYMLAASILILITSWATLSPTGSCTSRTGTVEVVAGQEALAACVDIPDGGSVRAGYEANTSIRAYVDIPDHGPVPFSPARESGSVELDDLRAGRYCLVITISDSSAESDTVIYYLVGCGPEEAVNLKRVVDGIGMASLLGTLIYGLVLLSRLGEGAEQEVRLGFGECRVASVNKHKCLIDVPGEGEPDEVSSELASRFAEVGGYGKVKKLGDGVYYLEKRGLNPFGRGPSKRRSLVIVAEPSPEGVSLTLTYEITKLTAMGPLDLEWVAREVDEVIRGYLRDKGRYVGNDQTD